MKKILFLIFIISLFVAIPSLAVVIEQPNVYDLHTPMSSDDILDKEKDAPVVRSDRNKGYYVDERYQVPKYHRIAPPNKEMIPETQHPTQTVVPFQPYYDINKLGVRRKEYMTPWIPNYNIHYSNRRATPYTKSEFIDVWCTGEKNISGVDCRTDEYDITFVRARDWAWGVTKAPFKSIRSKKKAAVFFMVDDLGLDAGYMHDAKQWCELFNLQMFFGTIDSFIPTDWIT